MAMALEFVHGFQAKCHKKYNYVHGVGIGLHADDTQLLIIRFPHFRVLRLVARSLLLALLILSFPYLGSFLGASLNSYRANLKAEIVSESINLALLPLVLRDLTNEGLLTMGDKAVFVSNGNEEAIYNSQILNAYEMDMISTTDSNQQSSISDDTFDFAFTYGFNDAKEFIDRTLKIGGIAVVQLSDDPFMGFQFQKLSNYKIVYLRRFDSTIVAMKKIGHANAVESTITNRRLCSFASEEKKAALKNLENVLLEPPRASSGKSRKYLKKTKYLPDLMGDSLKSYPRRVFIDVGLPEKEDGSDSSWFSRNYPTRNLHFDMYKIETVTTEESSGEEMMMPQIGMSDWLKKNVKEEEYVVMKAEAEVVEEMVKNKAISLVDELFLECKPKGQGKKGPRSKRAYWECLALYGRLTDEGVAVHQWWG